MLCSRYNVFLELNDIKIKRKVSEIKVTLSEYTHPWNRGKGSRVLQNPGAVFPNFARRSRLHPRSISPDFGRRRACTSSCHGSGAARHWTSFSILCSRSTIEQWTISVTQKSSEKSIRIIFEVENRSEMLVKTSVFTEMFRIWNTKMCPRQVLGNSTIVNEEIVNHTCCTVKS